MNILLNKNQMMLNRSPVAWCTGYRARSIVMQKGDFAELRKLAHSDPMKFNIVMTQLEGRFK